MDGAPFPGQQRTCKPKTGKHLFDNEQCEAACGVLRAHLTASCKENREGLRGISNWRRSAGNFLRRCSGEVHPRLRRSGEKRKRRASISSGRCRSGIPETSEPRENLG